MVATNARSCAVGAGGAAGARFDCSTTTHPPGATSSKSPSSARTSALISSLNGASTKTRSNDSRPRPSSPSARRTSAADDARAIGKFELCQVGANRRGRVARGIDKGYVSGAARERLDSERAAAGENIEHARAVEIDPHRESRKNRLARPRRGRPRQQTARRLEPAAVSMSRNNSHRVRLFEAFRDRDSRLPLASKSRTIDNPFCPTPASSRPDSSGAACASGGFAKF